MSEQKGPKLLRQSADSAESVTSHAWNLLQCVFVLQVASAYKKAACRVIPMIGGVEITPCMAISAACSQYNQLQTWTGCTTRTCGHIAPQKHCDIHSKLWHTARAPFVCWLDRAVAPQHSTQADALQVEPVTQNSLCAMPAEQVLCGMANRGEAAAHCLC